MAEGYDASGRPIDPGMPGAGSDTFRGERIRDPRGRAPAGGDESLGSLITGLLKDLQDLVRGEIKLARTELTEDAKQAGRGIAMLAAGAIVGLVGFIFLALAATYALDTWLDSMWLSALIVAAVLVVIAAILASIGKSRLSAGNLKPEQTIESLKEDQEWAKQQMNSVKR